MYPCCYCNYTVQDTMETCPSCDGDLGSIARLKELPDMYFNEALRAAQAGDLNTAANRLGAVLSITIKDCDAWMLLGLVYVRQGALRAARDCWNTVLMFNRNHSGARRALEALRRLEAPPGEQVSTR